MPSLKMDLHATQMKVYEDTHRYRLLEAGRRWGKNTLGGFEILKAGLESLKPVAYLNPERAEAKAIMWEYLKDKGKEIIREKNEADLTLTLVNGNKVCLYGTDKDPDRLRGKAWGFVQLDEFDSMKFEIWNIIKPSLLDVKGRALFTTSPKKNGNSSKLRKMFENDPLWGFHRYKTIDNPFIDPEEVEKDRVWMTKAGLLWMFQEEYEGICGEGPRTICPESWWEIVERRPPSHEVLRTWTAWDTSFGKEATKKGDPTGYLVFQQTATDWYIVDGWTGKLNYPMLKEKVKEVAALWKPYLTVVEDASSGTPLVQELRKDTSLPILAMSHNNESKSKRFAIATGHIRTGKLKLVEGDWNAELKEQCASLPDGEHDEFPDCVAYGMKIGMEDYQGGAKSGRKEKTEAPAMTKAHPYPPMEEVGEGPFKARFGGRVRR